jgi:hypothetical protein
MVLHSRLATVQQGEHYTRFNKRNPSTQITNDTNTTHLSNPATTKSAWCCPSERQPTPPLLHRRFHCLQTHPSGEIEIRIQQISSNGRRSQQGNRSNRTPYMVGLSVPLHNPTFNSPTIGALHTLQQKETRKHQPNPDYSRYKFSDNKVSVVLFFSVSANAFVPSAPISLTTDTPEWRDSKTIPMSDAGNTQSQQSPQSHSIHGGIERGSPQSTLNSPTSGALHTLQQKETRKHQSTNETKTTHNTNSATTKSAWCGPSERHPTPSLLRRRVYCLQTHPSGEIQTRFQQNSSNGRRCQRNKRTRYMVVLIVVLHNRL